LFIHENLSSVSDDEVKKALRLIAVRPFSIGKWKLKGKENAWHAKMF